MKRLFCIFCRGNVILVGVMFLTSCSERNDQQKLAEVGSSGSENEVGSHEEMVTFLKTRGTPRDWKYIVVHHSATDSGSVESIHKYHLTRKDSAGRSWRGIGYHFVIGNGNGMKDGQIEQTFRWREQMHGAHAGVTEYNSRGIGIVLIGNFEQSKPTLSQLESLRNLIQLLQEDHQISSSDIMGHKQLKATACPGRLFSMQSVLQARSQTDVSVITK